MTLWIILTVLTAAAAVIVTVPLARRASQPVRPGQPEIDLAREQIAEIEREVDEGTLDATEAGAARIEIERRALGAIRQAETAEAAPATGSGNLAIAIVAGWVVVGAVGLYTVTGRPDLPAVPVTRQATAAPTPRPAAAPAMQSSDALPVPAGTVDDAITALADRLRDNPDDADGWQMLGWSYYNTQQYDQAVAAYARAAALRPNDAELLSLYGETIVRAASGQVTEMALDVFDRALASNPDDARARFFKGMALEQAGDPAAALEAWLALLASAPPGADWAPGVEERVRELAAATGTDISGSLPQTPLGNGSLLPPPTPSRGPTAEDVAAAQDMTPQDRQEMIRGMVDGLQARLEENPNDPDGWIKLMRSRLVLGDPDAARAALEQAVAALGDDPASRDRIVAAAAEMGLRIE